MRTPHEPREDFVARLESVIHGAIRRRNEASAAAGWRGWLPFKSLAAAAALVAVSMAVGGGVVAVAYERQDNQRRDLIASAYERRLELAVEKLQLASMALREADMRVSIGTASPDDAADARLKHQEAETEVRKTQLQLEEIRMTGREPVDAVSAPAVSGRDFVTARWEADLELRGQALELEKRRRAIVQRRVEIGLADAAAVALADTRVIELESALTTLQRKLAVRREFLRGTISATTADLRVLRDEAEQRQQVLGRRLEQAKRDLARVQLRFERGLVQRVDVMKATVDVHELETQLAQAQLDLALLTRRLAEGGK